METYEDEGRTNDTNTALPLTMRRQQRRLRDFRHGRGRGAASIVKGVVAAGEVGTNLSGSVLDEGTGTDTDNVDESAHSGRDVRRE